MKLSIVIARSCATWQSHSAKIYLIAFFFVVASFYVPSVFADARSDYDYQYGQYRRAYPEYTLLKADYLNTPSLDNQQKVILSAKQAILSRDLAKASFAWYLMDLSNNTRTNYEPVRPILASLAATREFFLKEAQRSQSIVTQEDIKKFTQSYLKAVIHHDRVIKFGILAGKISSLVRLQLDQKAALDTLITRLPAALPATLRDRIQELRNSAKVIDDKIDIFAKNLDIQGDEESADAEIFFASRVERLGEIRTLQIDWINRLIDIDKNYAQTN